jgi:hypothetical protein
MKICLTRRRTTVALLVAAASLAVGGTATAATLITGAQIQDESVYSRDIANGTLSGTDVKDASLTPTDYDGPVVGPTGPTGPTGPAGPAGVRNVQYRVGKGIALDPGSNTTLPVPCPAGTRALSGGLSSTNPAAARILASAPQNDGVGWGVSVKNEGSAWTTAYAWVVCATA